MWCKKTHKQDSPDYAVYDPAKTVVNPAKIWSDFSGFLAEEWIWEEDQSTALKQIIAYQLQKDMKEKVLTKLEVAKRIKTSRSLFNLILNQAVITIPLNLTRAAQFADRRLTLTLT